MSAKTPVSVLVLTHNEIDFIERCLHSVRWADEIVVIDDDSADGTAEACRAAGAVVHQRKYDYYGAQSAWGLERCSNEWVFQIDADEECSTQLAQQIQDVFARPTPHAGFMLSIRPVFMGREIRHGNWGGRRRVRLFRKDGAIYEGPKNHEHLVLHGSVGSLSGYYYHYTVYDFNRWFAKQAQYAQYKCDDAVKKGKRFSLLKMLIHPPMHFFNAYVRRLGFLDGLAGFLIAAVGAYTVFMRYGLLLEKKWKFKT